MLLDIAPARSSPRSSRHRLRSRCPARTRSSATASRPRHRCRRPARQRRSGFGRRSGPGRRGAPRRALPPGLARAAPCATLPDAARVARTCRDGRGAVTASSVTARATSIDAVAGTLRARRDEGIRDEAVERLAKRDRRATSSTSEPATGSARRSLDASGHRVDRRRAAAARCSTRRGSGCRSATARARHRARTRKLADASRPTRGGRRSRSRFDHERRASRSSRPPRPHVSSRVPADRVPTTHEPARGRLRRRSHGATRAAAVSRSCCARTASSAATGERTPSRCSETRSRSSRCRWSPCSCSMRTPRRWATSRRSLLRRTSFWRCMRARGSTGEGSGAAR